MSGTENTDQQNPSVVTVCHLCGKVKRQGRKGTMTAWIFGGSVCTCDSASAFAAPSQELVESPLEKTLHLPNLSPTYEALSFIGEGGMGSVWKVRENSTGRLFAVKILRRELAQDPGSVKRFEQEVRAASELTHPNLVFVHGSDRMSDGTPYMVMRYIEGSDLSDIVRDEIALPLFRVMPIFTQAAEALKHAHAQGVIHRDLKPSNIIVTRVEDGSEHIRIVDFGIAKMISPGMNPELTQTGEVFGSPLYMSPEQCDGLKIDITSDIYSLGCVVYFMICGQPPFNDKTPLKIMMGHLQSKPKPMSTVRPEMFIPKELNTIVMKCLEKNPNQRYQSMQALLRDISIVSAKYPARTSIRSNTLQTGLHKAAEQQRRFVTSAIIGAASGVTGLLAFLAVMLFVAPALHHQQISGKPAPISKSAPESRSAPDIKVDTNVSKSIVVPKPARNDESEAMAKMASVSAEQDKIVRAEKEAEAKTSLAEASILPKKSGKEFITLCMSGQNKEHLNDIPGAVLDFAASLEANPMKDLTHGDKIQKGYKAITCQHLGFICCSKGRFREGIKWLSTAIALRPNYAENYRNRALAYNKLGEYILSQNDYTKANELTQNPRPDDISDSPGDFINK